MTKHIVSLLWAALVPLLFWLGGFDFNERGAVAVLCIASTMGAWCFSFMYPGWES
jgi:hypothetical protein